MTERFIKPKYPLLFVPIFAFVSLFALSMHQKVWSTNDINGEWLPNDSIGHFFSRLLLAVSGSGNSTVHLLVFCLLVFALWHVYVSNPSVIVSGWFLILSAIYSVFYVLAISFEDYQNWQPLIQSNTNLILTAFQVLGLTFVFYTLFSVLYYYFSKIDFFAELMFLNSKSTFLKRWLLIAINWLVYLSVFFPINTDNDFASQISSFFGGKSQFYLATFKYLRNTSVITDHHPVFTTFVYGTFAKLGLLLGSINLGIYIYGIVTCLLYAAICTYSVSFFAKMGMKKRAQKWMVLTYAFFPLFPLYATTATKNVPYSFLMILWVLQLIRMKENPKRYFHSFWFLVSFSLVLFFQMLVVKYAVQVALVFSIFFVYHYRKFWKQVALAMFIPIALFIGPYENGLLPALHITKTNPSEALSVPFQQTARYVKEYPQDVTGSERRTLDKVFYYSKIAQNYNPDLSDPIKDASTVRVNTIRPKDLKDYRKVWFQQLVKHPMIYVEATLNNIYGYFSFNYVNAFATMGVNVSPTWNPNIVTGNKRLKLISADEMPVFSRNVIKYFNAITRVPIFAVLIQPHTYLFLTLLIAVALAYRKLWSAQIVVLPVLLNVLVDVVSPANGMFRYMIVFVVCCPIILSYCNYELKRKNKE